VIAEHQENFSVTRMCEVLNVSPSGYYAWRKRPVSAREMANQELLKRIEAVYNDSYGTYGSPRIYRELKAQGVACSENRVARLMRLYHIRAQQTRRYKATTRRNKAHPAAPNLLQQDFSAERPDHKWLADITYIPTLEGWLYLAAILDLYTRRIVGWAMSERMTGELTMAALKMAIHSRQPGPGLIHHSDQGSQYTDGAYQALLKEHGIQVSMNNDCLGWIKWQQEFLQDGRCIDVDFRPNWDFVKVAEAAGCFGTRVERAEELPGALQEAFTANNRKGIASVVDVHIL
jgi:putative transposase